MPAWFVPSDQQPSYECIAVLDGPLLPTVDRRHQPLVGGESYKAWPIEGLHGMIRAVAAGVTVKGHIKTFSSWFADPTKVTGQVTYPDDETDTPIGELTVFMAGYDTSKCRMLFTAAFEQHWGEDGFGYLPFGYVEQYGSGFVALIE